MNVGFDKFGVLSKQIEKTTDCQKIVVNLQDLGHPNLVSNTKQKSLNSYNFWHQNVSFKLGKNRQSVMLLTKQDFFFFQRKRK